MWLCQVLPTAKRRVPSILSTQKSFDLRGLAASWQSKAEDMLRTPEAQCLMQRSHWSRRCGILKVMTWKSARHETT